MKEFSREWFLAQSEAASRVVDGWPDSMKKNLVIASANLPVMTPTKTTVVATSEVPNATGNPIIRPAAEPS